MPPPDRRSCRLDILSSTSPRPSAAFVPQKAGSTGKLAYEKDFVWPLAPLTQGGSVNLTTVPANGTSLDLATCLIDPGENLRLRHRASARQAFDVRLCIPPRRISLADELDEL